MSKSSQFSAPGKKRKIKLIVSYEQFDHDHSTL